jgi:hypothetical protein
VSHHQNSIGHQWRGAFKNSCFQDFVTRDRAFCLLKGAVAFCLLKGAVMDLEGDDAAGVSHILITLLSVTGIDR